MTRRVGAIVLAGGRSSRFGRDKLVEPLDGRPLVDHAIGAVAAVAGETVVVLAPGRRLAVGPGVRAVHDPTPFDGPLAGLSAGLAALDPKIERVIVVAGDMPGLVPAVLARLLDTLGSDGDGGAPERRAAVLAHGDDRPPLPMAIDRAAAEVGVALALERGERRLRDLVAALAATIVPEASWRADDPDAATLRDIDVPDDLPARG